MDAAVPVIVRDQHLKRLQLMGFLRDHPVFIQRCVKIQFYRKHGSFSHFAFHSDGAAHQSNQIFRNRHTEAGTTGVLGNTVILLLERNKQAFQECIAHSNPGIEDGKAKTDSVFLPLELADFKPYRTSGRRKLQRIGQQIQQNLVQS